MITKHSIPSKRFCAAAMAVAFLGLGACKDRENKILDTPLRGEAGTFENNVLVVDGEVRHYRLVVAPALNLDTPNKIIFAFHGLGIDSKDVMPAYTGLNALAERMQAIVVYPDAQKGSWGLNQQQTDKDLRFFDLLLERIRSAYAIDTRNIHIAGMSNGAYFCHILARHNSERIASVSAHSGMIGLEFVFGIHAKIKYPVLLIHGRKDPIFSIQTARNDWNKYQQEGHPARLIEVADLGHAWASGIQVNDSIAVFIRDNPLK